VLLLGNELGYHKYEMHEILKNKFAPAKSRELNIQEFDNYCETIRCWAIQELGVKIPMPNEC
jgi:hypothetical protein